jgi:hypothetical protein
MKKNAWAVFLLCLTGGVYGADDAGTANVMAARCNLPSAEAEIIGDMYDAGSLTSIALQILSGNTADAVNALGGEISIRVLMLNEQREHNPCKLPPEKLERIYPFFRVIAAANARKPIPGVDDDAEVMAILKNAIDNDPANYKKQIERSRDWDHGIR